MQHTPVDEEDPYAASEALDEEEGRWWPILLGAFVVLALVTLAFSLPWRTWLRPGRDAPSFESRLAEAVGDYRPYEARLWGGFTYGPVRSRPAARTTTEPDARLAPDASAVIAEIDDWAVQSGSPRAQAVLGIARLFEGRLDESTESLRAAAVALPNEAGIQSDLSAALVVRAIRLGEPADAERALAAADRALRLAPDAAAPRFNRALAFETLGRYEQAQSAWNDYLARDASSGWAEEARSRLASLGARQP